MKGSGSSALISVDEDPVPTQEFLYVYNKNNQNNQPKSREEIDDYLDLFINFKLKVREAEALGLHKDSSFIKELQGYQKQLANPYLAETRLLDSMARITYERLETEINASHILIQVASDAKPEDTLAAYNRIISHRESIIDQGKTFEQIAQDYSEDPSAKQNQGNLGYFTAMQMVYPFEEAAYNLPIDSISDPVRTSFGYHIIKVHDKRTSQGRVQVSHILIRAQNGISEKDSALAANRAFEIYQKASNNEDWDLLCRQFSEDLGTKMKGGALPWFKTGDISNIPAFEKAAFTIEKVGSIHEPVKTAYGWHIIRLDNKQGLEEFEVLEPKIRSSLTANSRAALNQHELVKRLKKENKFKEHQAVVDEAMQLANVTLNKGTWKSQPHWVVQSKELFSIDKTSYPVSEFYQYVEAHQPLKYQEDPTVMMRLAYQDFVRERLIDYEEQHLGEKFYDYKMLHQEYRDGILLFQLMESKVWNQAIQDTAGLRSYFDGHRNKYQWDDRVSANVFNVADEAALKEVESFLEKGYFSYTKYDFYGTNEELNKAQERILNNISQLLKQDPLRSLVMNYSPSRTENDITYQNILNQLATQNIDSSKITVQHSMNDTPEFIVHIISSSLHDLEENMNRENPLTIKVENGRYQHGDNPAVDQVNWQKGIQTIELDDRLVLVEIQEVIPKGNQELEEIKGQVISDYQTLLESQWINELRNKYQVDIHEKELESVYKRYNL